MGGGWGLRRPARPRKIPGHTPFILSYVDLHRPAYDGAAPKHEERYGECDDDREGQVGDHAFLRQGRGDRRLRQSRACVACSRPMARRAVVSSPSVHDDALCSPACARAWRYCSSVPPALTMRRFHQAQVRRKETSAAVIFGGWSSAGPPPVRKGGHRRHLGLRLPRVGHRRARRCRRLREASPTDLPTAWGGPCGTLG